LVKAGDQYPVGHECYGRNGQVSGLPGVIFDGPADGAADGRWFRMEGTVRIKDACQGKWLAIIEGGMAPLPARAVLSRTFVPTSTPDACGLSSASCLDFYQVEVTPR
jgi:hypothetical protein